MTPYLEFLKEKNLIDKHNESIAAMDLRARRLLEHIAIAHGKSTPITVGQAIARREIGSPSTIHKKIDNLRTAELIKLVYKDKNRQTKFLIPTKSATAYFEALGTAIYMALTSSS